MFAIIVKVLELIATALKSLKEHEKKLQRNSFGRDLATFYIQLMEVINAGEHVITEFARYARHYNLGMKGTARGWPTIQQNLLDLLAKQADCLDRLENSLFTLMRPLTVLAPDAMQKLEQLLGMKGQAIRTIAYSLRAGKIPSRLVLSDVREGALGGISIEAALSVPEWDKVSMQNVEEYLNAEAPNEKLEELRRLAEQVRGVLSSNFSVDEILCATGYKDAAKEAR